MRRFMLWTICALCGLAGCAHENTSSEYMGTGSMDQEQVMQLLNQHGFVDISNLHKNGADWVGSASKDGQAVSFDIDKRGTIRTR